MQFNFDMPRFNSAHTDIKDIKEIKSWLFRFSEQLGYVLSNLDGDNLSDDLKGELKGELESIAASLKASVDRLSAELTAVKAEITSKPSYVTGTALADASGEAAISYGPLPAVPVITAIVLSDSVFGVTVKSASTSGAVLRAENAPEGAEILWTAIY